VCPCTTRVGWAWDHGFEMCALVLHAWVGQGTMGLKCALVLHAWVGHGTMGLKCVSLYYTRGWAWDHGFEMCESTSYIITRVDATSFRSLFLIISTLVVGES